MIKIDWGDEQVFQTAICNTCSVHFGMPHGYLKHRRDDKRDFFCPNGHKMAYAESTEDALRRERDRLKQQLAQKDDEITAQRGMREAAERQAAAARGQVTRLRNRGKAGLCPCCNRHFTNLERHMATKHTDEKANVVALVHP